MPYKIITDSTMDMPRKLADEMAVDVLPLMFTIDGEEYRDNFGADMDPHVFYEKVREGKMPTTTLINTERFLDAFPLVPGKRHGHRLHSASPPR